MGIGMALICPPDALAPLTRHLLAAGRVFRIGEVVAGSDPTTPGQVFYKRKEGGGVSSRLVPISQGG
jgi:hypothetical protein